MDRHGRPRQPSDATDDLRVHDASADRQPGSHSDPFPDPSPDPSRDARRRRLGRRLISGRLGAATGGRNRLRSEREY